MHMYYKMFLITERLWQFWQGYSKEKNAYAKPLLLYITMEKYMYIFNIIYTNPH